MALKDVFKFSRKTFFNPSGWFGVDYFKVVTRTIWGLVSPLFVLPEARRTETFEQALERLKLTDADVQQTGQVYFIYALIFAACSIGAVIFGLYYLFVHSGFFAFLVALSVAALFASQAFRYHFWFFQIKHRKLGCTFDEWWQGKMINQEPKP